MSQASNEKLDLEEGISRGMKKLKIENQGVGTHRKLTDSKLAEMGKLKQPTTALSSQQQSNPF